MLVRNRPSEAGLAEIVNNDGKLAEHNSVTWGSFRMAAAIYLRMLKDWDIWTVALGALFVKVTRYSLMFWLPLYLIQRLRYSPGEAGYTSSLFEISGIRWSAVGRLHFGQVHAVPPGARSGDDDVGPRIGVLDIHPELAATGSLGVALSIGLIGIMNYGPDTLLQGAASQDVGAKWGVGKASGFVNGVSSFGQMFSSYLVAYIFKDTAGTRYCTSS